MRRLTRVLASLLFAVLLLSTIAGHAQVAEAETRTVVVVLAPYLGWADLTGERMPVTRSLAESSTIGNANIRTSMRYAVNSLSQTHVALTMSAGSPIAFDATAPSAHAVDQRLEIGTAGEAYARSMGQDYGSAAIVYLGLPRIMRANEDASFASVPGALGGAIVDAGGSTAAVGNSDGGYRGGDVFRSRPAAVFAMDASGLVQYGNISTSLLEEDASAPYGVVTDADAVASAYRDALRKTAAHGGPALIVLDPGDSERALNFTVDASPEAAEAHRLAAAETVDEVVSLALKGLPDDAVLMVVSTGQVRPTVGPSGFGQVIISGPGFDGGLIESPSTHRLGLMTDLDIAATTLSVLGIDRPVEVLGNGASASDSRDDLASRVAVLEEMHNMAVAVDTVRPFVQNSYITITVLVLLACAALLRSMQRALSGWGGRAAGVFSAVILLMLAMPVSATLMYLFVPRPQTALVVALLFTLTTLAVWGLTLLVNRRRGSATALAVIGLLSAGVLLLDQLLGAPLSFSGLFSYSPLLGARYYGLGNEGASVIVGGALIGLAFLIEISRDRPWLQPLRQWGPIVLGVAVVVISAAPSLGANVGVIAWGTVAFGVFWMQLAGRRMTWKTVLAFLAIIVGVVAAFSLYEVFVGSGAQTHLGRAWESAGTGGISELWLIVARKAETNWRVLRATNWSILMVAILSFLGFMRWRPHGVFAETLEASPAFAAAMTAALWGSLVGYFTEDSGIVIPALVMLYVTGSLLHTMLSRFGDSADAVAS